MAIDIITEKTFQSSGTDHSNVLDVPVGAKEVDLYIDRTYLTDAKTAIAVQLFFSPDGGLSWKPYGGFGTMGGEIVEDESKQVAKKSGMLSALPDPENPNRKIMATLSVLPAGKSSLKAEFR